MVMTYQERSSGSLRLQEHINTLVHAEIFPCCLLARIMSPQVPAPVFTTRIFEAQPMSIYRVQDPDPPRPFPLCSITT